MAQKIFEDMYMVDSWVREFFIIGDDHVLLIDTGTGQFDLESEIRQYTDLPIEVVLTHGHGDHTGGCRKFDKIYISDKDKHMTKDLDTLPMPGTFDVGQYHFEVIEIPGHTYGSIALLDKEKKLLIAGDSVQEGPIYMFGNDASVEAYVESMKKLQGYKDNIETVLASHHSYLLTSDYIDYCLEDIQAYQRGELEGVRQEQPQCTMYQGTHVSFYL